MATTQLSDIIDVVVFSDIDPVFGPEKTAMMESGVAVRTPQFDQLANGDGKSIEMPFWKDLDESSEPNLSSDDPTSSASPVAVAQGEQLARKAFLNKGWSAADLAAEMASGDRVMEHVRARVDRYWMRQWQRRLIATASGIQADNVANDSGDMVYDIAGATNGDVGGGTKFSRTAFTSAAFTMGDMQDGVSAIGVHSAVYKTMLDNDDIDFVPDSNGEGQIATFLGRRVIVDDSLPFTPAGGALAGDSAPKYTSILFGNGAIGYGEGMPKVPVELDRAPAQGDGGGVETLWMRKTWLLHPFGFQQTGVPAGVSFTSAELAAATSWDRVVERKNVPLAFLVTNG